MSDDHLIGSLLAEKDYNMCVCRDVVRRIVGVRDLSSFIPPHEYEAYIATASNWAGDQTNLTGFSAPALPSPSYGQTAVPIDAQKDYDDFPEHLRSKWRPLGSGFGHVYLGETFSCYTHCKNISPNECVYNLSIRVELQLPSQRLIQLGQIAAAELGPLQMVGEALRHEVKELGVHL